MHEKDIKKGKYLDKATEKPLSEYYQKQFDAERLAPISKLPPKFRVFYDAPEKVYWGFVDYEIFSTPVKELYFSHKDTTWNSINSFSYPEAEHIALKHIAENQNMDTSAIHVYISKIDILKDSTLKIQFTGNIILKDSVHPKELYSFISILDNNRQIKEFNLTPKQNTITE